jgi:hypothetical protein
MESPHCYGPNQEFTTPKSPEELAKEAALTLAEEHARKVGEEAAAKEAAAKKHQEEETAAAAAQKKREEEAGSKPPVVKTVTPKILTKAQKLAKALRACKKGPKKKRASCEKQAKKKYGTAGKKASKKGKKK